ncbi:hypothetical protein GOARA_045_00850 [Gordonia araii NBRC 100433]|uniref:Uncharacterized protein n=1 Tax=Gordonia araii NBRC 100433 TaxID=1073574 RepID=G7H1K6_9ACTN|nr:hypothetical protein [Gordonia araii]NNG97760.1 hypothetical protein [Gordonia araii NBRC 100433]GAB09731.1 hypothetical protein GOARA_045_00850 [Gordonia araii NBRC 100433]
MKMWEIEDQLNGGAMPTAAGTGPLVSAVPQRTAMMSSMAQSADVMSSLATVAASAASIYALSNTGQRPINN